MSYNLENLKDRIERFGEELVRYSHNDILSANEGREICKFLVETIGELLECNVDVNKDVELLRVEVKNDDLEHLGLKEGEWYKAEKYIDEARKVMYKVYGDNKYSIKVESNMIEELGKWS